jgi:predicted RNase H-like HicB family nuclease
MIDLKYSLVIEATADPVFFGFYSPELEGFSGVGHSIEDCIYRRDLAWTNMSPSCKTGNFQFLSQV